MKLIPDTPNHAQLQLSKTFEPLFAFMEFLPSTLLDAVPEEGYPQLDREIELILRDCRAHLDSLDSALALQLKARDGYVGLALREDWEFDAE